MRGWKQDDIRGAGKNLVKSMIIDVAVSFFLVDLIVFAVLS